MSIKLVLSRTGNALPPKSVSHRTYSLLDSEFLFNVILKSCVKCSCGMHMDTQRVLSATILSLSSLQASCCSEYLKETVIFQQTNAKSRVAREGPLGVVQVGGCETTLCDQKPLLIHCHASGQAARDQQDITLIYHHQDLVLKESGLA